MFIYLRLGALRLPLLNQVLYNHGDLYENDYIACNTLVYSLRCHFEAWLTLARPHLHNSITIKMDIADKEVFVS